jgi:uncharacterized protein YndB with AHSA1/START domain
MNGATKDASGVSHAGRVFFYFRQPAYVNNEELLPENREPATKLPVSSKKPVAAWTFAHTATGKPTSSFLNQNVSFACT